jgi:hypothetical protein
MNTEQEKAISELIAERLAELRVNYYLLKHSPSIMAVRKAKLQVDLSD